MPSLRLNVACVGHTRTHGGSSQWLQSTGTPDSLTASGRYASSMSAKLSSKGSSQIHLISSLGSSIEGML